MWLAASWQRARRVAASRLCLTHEVEQLIERAREAMPARARKPRGCKVQLATQRQLRRQGSHAAAQERLVPKSPTCQSRQSGGNPTLKQQPLPTELHLTAYLPQGGHLITLSAGEQVLQSRLAPEP